MKVEREWAGVKKDKERFKKNRIFLLGKSERDFAFDSMNFEGFCLLIFLSGADKDICVRVGRWQLFVCGLWITDRQGPRPGNVEASQKSTRVRNVQSKRPPEF